MTGDSDYSFLALCANSVPLSRNVNDLTQIKIQLESERESLSGALADAENANADLENRLAAATTALNNIKVELERRLREKEDELEALRLVDNRYAGYGHIQPTQDHIGSTHAKS